MGLTWGQYRVGTKLILLSEKVLPVRIIRSLKELGYTYFITQEAYNQYTIWRIKPEWTEWNRSIDWIKIGEGDQKLVVKLYATF